MDAPRRTEDHALVQLHVGSHSLATTEECWAMMKTGTQTMDYQPEPSKYASSVHAILSLVVRFVGSLILGGLAAFFLGRAFLTIPFAIVIALAFYLRRRQLQQLPQARLRVVTGDLEIEWTGADGWRGGPARREAVTRIPLAALSDVCLDTRTIEQVTENLSGGVPGARFINATVGPKLDMARIELKFPEGPLWLSEAHRSHTDSTDWCRKLRLMLREHDWLPSDERAEAASPKTTSQGARNVTSTPASAARVAALYRSVGILETDYQLGISKDLSRVGTLDAHEEELLDLAELVTTEDAVMLYRHLESCSGEEQAWREEFLDIFADFETELLATGKGG